MYYNSRRQFIADAGKTTFATGLGIFTAKNEMPMAAKKGFIHHVYFWLKNPANQQDLQKLIKGLQTLSAVKTIKEFHIGKPAGTNRDVIDSSYSVSWMLVFENKADQDSYQTDPIHLNFVEQCKDLWTKVIVYDSVEAV
ncbi:MAG TPA: Dabb family protein [Flavitalea sp.]|nr:Dabb family protein [Flavitalea sp.]